MYIKPLDGVEVKQFGAYGLYRITKSIGQDKRIPPVNVTDTLPHLDEVCYERLDLMLGIVITADHLRIKIEHRRCFFLYLDHTLRTFYDIDYIGDIDD